MRKAQVACAVVFTALLAGACAQDGGKPGPQGWTADQRTKWYTYSQGSRLLPLAWARALEQADSTALFLDPAHIKKLGYLASPDGKPGALPVGFAADATPDARLTTTAFHWKAGQGAGTSPTDKSEPWLGMNCSACHTAQITYQGKVMTVDGGPALSDFQTFLADLRASLAQTAADPAKFGRFAARVLTGADDTPANRQMLMAALQQLSAHEQALGAINATDLKYGYGRLDAFGHIFSKVAYAAAGKAAVPQPSDAPTSYPFLWGIPYEDLIQYNGIAKNVPSPVGVHKFDPGALARNTGEVVGVFADVQLTDQPLKGYRSSANIDNLVWFEQQLEALRAPPWPGEAVFGPKGKLDPALVAEGRKLFGTDNTDPGKTTCATCHAVVPPNDQTRAVKIRMSRFQDPDPPGTDPMMACDAYMRTGPAGVLKGTPRQLFTGQPLEDQPPLADLLKVGVAGILLDQGQKVAAVAVESVFGYNRPTPPPITGLVPLNARAAMLQTCLSTKSDILGYKARPLNGIWATAPYLHNGSVPTLAELLNPAKRSPTFWVGNREYDPVNLGYVSTPNVGSMFDTSLPGNSNKGHDYGTSALTDTQRRALLEYMKTL